jgi:hypothetical protein
MQLTINYADRSKRIINLHPTFFHAHDVSWEERAMHLAYDTGKPARVELIRDGEAVMTRRVWSNMLLNEPEAQPIDEREVKKALRKQFKGIPFTSCSKYQL